MATVAEQLEGASKAILMEYAANASIGSPVTDAAAFFDEKERATTSKTVNEYLDRLGDVEAE